MDKPGEQVKRIFSYSGENVAEPAEVRYLLFLPEEYDKAQDVKWPLLLFLHGAGERGDNLALVARHGPPKIVNDDKRFPFVVVSPQAPAGGDWMPAWKPEQLMALVDHVSAAHRVDRDRIYVTGLSMGGYGAWRLAAAYPERFAAAAPICGGGRPETAEKLKSVPIWAFHGDKDQAVPLQRSEEMVAAVQRAGGNARLTIYPGVGHDSWTQTYNNPEVYKWLLSHRRHRE